MQNNARTHCEHNNARTHCEHNNARTHCENFGCEHFAAINSILNTLSPICEQSTPFLIN